MDFLDLDASFRSAVLSPCRVYRYALWRRWGPNTKYALFIGLNPSTADETCDDPTIRRCVGFARDWGYDGLCMANLFAFRATNPRDMLSAPDPVGPENDVWIRDLSRDASISIAAWGSHGGHLGRDHDVMTMVPDLHCLGVTKTGKPRHPLYLRSDTKPFPYTHT